ncbi:dihydropyrimidinase [Rhodococcus sp. 15-725-2-2b]|uniref:dihydropyrimidinase n=1 Tax=unclassified Rhodococcus (in: high G+C Gram-positive bacteria) TaxID=192944 RepID=UPI000B9B5915|nr:MULTISPECIES: dihydropyrimidinase [unclassified Rhodococcus (in: high G+C Gram-positive bacteria)]OZC72028.1 dihydropyrimidinase [Rhodococcus sp. 06-469-3-2]OZD42649.1 dihydropyrimidinase [Rhodococcus sp. 06-1477-1A]OZE06257.1 dihydropyrimidinase [Rhodococcus sp. 05-2255-3B1]OZE09304.1 dihydropyrimidinase [Rhodococcus sp. 05-2255-3C]OZE18410.1 dihydropyrimidinase [Rhodococcus sp. 05-2255-2A2]
MKVVRGGMVVESHWAAPADLLIDDGRVVAVLTPGSKVDAAAEVIDATGKLVMPGGVDPHCHVGFTSGEFTSLDSYLECTTAAVFGGTTTIIDFAIPRPGQQPLDAAEVQRAKASSGLCDSALHACVVEWTDTTADQLKTLADAGIRTVKMFTTYAGETMANEHTILNTMQTTRDLGGMVIIHCESDAIVTDAQNLAAASDGVDAAHMSQTRPELAETASVAAILAIAESQSAPVYFVHQSTPAAVELVADARKRGLVAFTESVAHHLILDDSAYEGEQPEGFVCCPPLRSAEVVEELGRHLFTGHVTTIGSDHCCYDTAQKQVHSHDVRHMPNGLPGVETRLPVIYSHYVDGLGLTASRFVELTSANPARTNGLYPRKGSLMPGSDADIAIWDPELEWTVTTESLHMATDYTPYEGHRLRGKPVTVIVRGEIVVHDGELIDATPRGRHLEASPLDFSGAFSM